MTDDTIPTGDPTTVPISELEELVAKWSDSMAARKKDYYAPIGLEIAAEELQDLINEHDPKQ